MRTQLTELELGISGALNVTERMETLGIKVRDQWDKWILAKSEVINHKLSHDILYTSWWISTLGGASGRKSCLDVADLGYANAVKDSSSNPRTTQSQIAPISSFFFADWPWFVSITNAVSPLAAFVNSGVCPTVCSWIESMILGGLWPIHPWSPWEHGFKTCWAGCGSW